MIEFRRPEFEDKALIESYLKKQHARSCELTFANTYLWSRHYGVEFAIIEDMLVYKSKDEEPGFTFPLGEEQNVKRAMEGIDAYCKEKGIKYHYHLITREQFEVMDQLYPGKFTITYNRDAADYVYEREKLANLSGKKYHGKKNHVNKFIKSFENWSYESITEENKEECFQMALNWRNANGCDEDEEKNAEMCVTLNYLRLFSELGMRGGLLRVDGRVVAFSIGEKLTEDTMVVHIEKAYADVPGAYPMINQQFVLHETEGFTYINREEDTGAEGLRQAKLSYHPIFLVEKGIVRF
jgi:hypothetical protein